MKDNMPLVISEYKLLLGLRRGRVFKRSKLKIEKEVEEHIRDGWVPLGGPTCANHTIVIQAMVKYIER